MTWYAWIIVILLVLSLIGTWIYFFIKINKPIKFELSAAERKALDQEFAEKTKLIETTQKDRDKKIVALLDQYQLNLKKLEFSYKNQLKVIDDQQQTDFDRYLRDTDLAGHDLDLLLGIRRDDDTDGDTLNDRKP